MKRLFLVVIFLVCVTNGFAQGRSDDDAAIRKVLDIFMQGIINKDTVAMYALFAANIPVAWIQVQPKATLEAEKVRNPKSMPVESDTHANFIRYVGRTKSAVEERFYNIKLRHDGSLATVSFDYSFWSNGKKENWGQENWELVYNGEGWKIAGVYYSYNAESVIKEPFKSR